MAVNHAENFAARRQAMVEATRVFGEVNEAVRSQERRLRQDLHEEAVAESLSALQTSEEAKLRFTLIQQVPACPSQSAGMPHFCTGRSCSLSFQGNRTPNMHCDNMR